MTKMSEVISIYAPPGETPMPGTALGLSREGQPRGHGCLCLSFGVLLGPANENFFSALWEIPVIAMVLGYVSWISKPAHQEQKEGLSIWKLMKRSGQSKRRLGRVPHELEDSGPAMGRDESLHG